MNHTSQIQEGDAVFVKMDIAKEYLNFAIRCYIEQHDYFCAIHLAGAAEELFGMWLRKEDRISTINFEMQKRFHSAINSQAPKDKEIWRLMNWSKNTIKHMDDGNPHIVLNPIVEAAKWIELAIMNHNKCGFPKSEMILKFEEYRNQETEKAFASVGYSLITVNEGLILEAEADADIEVDEFGGQFGGQD